MRTRVRGRGGGQRSRWEPDPIGQREGEELGRLKVHSGGSDGGWRACTSRVP